jgi:hypothetical protein
LLISGIFHSYNVLDLSWLRIITWKMKQIKRYYKFSTSQNYLLKDLWTNLLEIQPFREETPLFCPALLRGGYWSNFREWLDLTYLLLLVIKIQKFVSLLDYCQLTNPFVNFHFPSSAQALVIYPSLALKLHLKHNVNCINQSWAQLDPYLSHAQKLAQDEPKT